MAVLFCGAKQTVKNCEKPITKGFENRKLALPHAVY